MADPSRATLITGCSTGIGRATAIRLAKGGWPVYATARRIDSISDLESSGCRTLQLDVTDTESMRAAVQAVEKEHGAVGVLINNAGYSVVGAVESTPMAEVRRQFETNLFGSVEMAQLCLPGMRDQGWGRIVNVSSMGGKLTLPGQGFYNATKHAMESMSDALRFEVAAFGVDVVVIEPGLIRSGFNETAVDNAHGVEDEGPYGRFNAHVAAVIDNAYRGLIGRASAGPDRIARLIEKAIAATRPRARYVAPANARLLLLVRRVAPDRVWDALLGRVYTRPGPR